MCSGVVMGFVSIFNCYMYSVVEMIFFDDIDYVVDLFVVYVSGFDGSEDFIFWWLELFDGVYKVFWWCWVVCFWCVDGEGVGDFGLLFVDCFGIFCGL